MPKSLIILVAKLVLFVERLFGRGGGALPGLIAELMDAQILVYLAKKNFSNGVVIITGTNGKTTTAALTAQILQAAGHKVLHNRGGSNLMRGIISAILQQSNLAGQVEADVAVLEVDENAFVLVSQYLKPTQVVITNLFRDQLDRYGELDSTAKKLQNALAKLKARVLLNADDPLVASLGRGLAQVHYFGLNTDLHSQLEDQWAADSLVSPISGEPLVYSKRYYSHLGVYTSTDFKRPELNFEASQIQATEESLSFSFKYKTTRLELITALGGLYNVYNVLVACSVAVTYDVEITTIKQVLANFQPAFGRLEIINYKHKSLHLLLIKNPVGFNQIIETFLLKNAEVPVVIAINDKIADSRDVSWLWDASLEALAGQKRQIIVSGRRAYDMALRLKYAGVSHYEIITDTHRAVAHAISIQKNSPKVYLVPTYTAMLDIRSWLVKKSGQAEYWQ